MNGRRIATLVGKELLEFRSNPAAIIPVAIMIMILTAMPFVVLLLVPWLTGESLADDRSVWQVMGRAHPGMTLRMLPPVAAVQAFFFQEFILLFLIAPIVSAVSLAAYSVVGEKQRHTLEPLLTTPLTTPEILVAKVTASFLPSLAIEALGVTVYFALIAALAEPGVFAALFVPRSAVLIGLVGPLASLLALQTTIAVSSRVSDPRSAQQIAMLLVIPIVAMVVGQVAGAFFVTTAVLLLLACGLAVAWALLILLSVALFERETILTRWK